MEKFVPSNSRQRKRIFKRLRPESQPPAETVEEARLALLRILKRRKNIAEWIRGNRKAMDECTSDGTRLTLRQQNLLYSEAYEQTNSDVGCSIRDYFDTRGRELSINLASSIPTELRTMIFTFLMVESGAVAIGTRSAYAHRSDRPLSRALDEMHMGSRLETLIESKLYLRAKFMGDLLVEVRETFPFCNSFHVFDSLDLESNIKPCKSGLYNELSMDPTNCIRYLIVELGGDIEKTFQDRASFTNRYPKSAAELCSPLEHLLKINRPKSFQLKVIIAAENKNRLDDILEALQDVHTRLKAVGYKVQVTSRDHARLKYPQSLDSYFDPQTD